MAAKMLKKVYEIKSFSEITRLTIKEVENLKKNLKQNKSVCSWTSITDKKVK